MKIIAECGCNYKNMEEAKEMIRECKRLNLFLCKFQIFNEDNIKDIEDPKVREFLRSIMLDYDKAKELFDYGREIGQEVFFTPMFLEAVNWCKKIGCSIVKVREKDSENYKLLAKIDYCNFKEIIISSEISPFCLYEFDIENDYHYFYNVSKIFCIPKYPAQLIDYLFEDSDQYRGISDHTQDLQLFKLFYEKYKGWDENRYFEKHVCLTKDCLEAEWSCTFKELEEALK